MQIDEEVHCGFLVKFVIFVVGAFLAEELMFHLFKLNRSENEVAGGDFVAERFTYLRDTERDFCSRRSLYVQKVDEFALSRFGAEVNFVLTFFRNPARGFKHKVELSYRRKVALAALRANDVVFFDIVFHFLVGHEVGVDGAVRMGFD